MRGRLVREMGRRIEERGWKWEGVEMELVRGRSDVS